MAKLFKLLFLLSFFSISSIAATLGLDSSDEPVFYLRNDLGANLNELIINVGGDSKTETAAITLYVPLSTGAGQSANYYLDNANLGDGSSTTSGIVLSAVNIGSQTNEEMYIAIKNNDNGSPKYRIVTEIAQSSMSAPFVSFLDLCTTSELDCTEITDAVSGIKENLYLAVFFVADGTDYSNNQEVTLPTEDNQVLYFKTLISASVADIRDNTTLNGEAYSGDSMGIIDYTGDHGSSGQYISRVAKYISPGGTGTVTVSDFLELVEDQSEDGSVTFTGLDNNAATDYEAVIAYVDNFGFRSNFSSPASLFDPMPIETLLSESQCYLVSAGFAREHYVLNYFRYIRDEYLLKNSLGQAFVDIYYNSAPKYVKYILKNSQLSLLIKQLSFAIYFVLQNIHLTLLFILGIILLTFRREIKHAI